MIASEKTLRSTIGRAYIYLSIFIIGLAVHELILLSIHYVPYYRVGIVLSLCTIAVFTLVGFLFASERHIRSRVTSGATLFVLGVIALTVGRFSAPDAYILVLALGVASLGAQPVLHRKLTNSKRAVLYSLLTAVTALAFAITFYYSLYMYVTYL